MDEHFPSYYGPSSITAGLDRIISRDIVDHTFDTPASATEQMVISPLTTRPAMEPKLPKKRRRLDYLKCDFCRRGKKKVSIVHVCCPLTQDVAYNLIYLVRAVHAPMAG